MSKTGNYETFWTWSLRHYAKPGVAKICLTLQNQYGDDVNFLLWLCWCASCGRSPNMGVMTEALGVCDRWQKAGIAALREQRHALTPDATGVLSPHDQKLKAALLQQELNLEKQQQAELEALHTSKHGGKPATLAHKTLAQYHRRFCTENAQHKKLSEQLIHAVLSS